MKTIITIREKIATRAYFAWLDGSTAGHVVDWLAAEAIETALAERRAASAAKAAATRRANAASKPAAAIVAASRRRSSASRPTAH